MASGISGDRVLESVNIDDFQANCNQERAFRVALKALRRRRSNRNVHRSRRFDPCADVCTDNARTASDIRTYAGLTLLWHATFDQLH